MTQKAIRFLVRYGTTKVPEALCWLESEVFAVLHRCTSEPHKPPGLDAHFKIPAE